MKQDIATIIEKLILPISDGWKLDRVELQEEKEEISVYLYYDLKKYGDYSLYDGREERKWRHLDLWQYKTFINCNLPRYKDENGKVKTIEVPWAGAYERMSWMLEKKR